MPSTRFMKKSKTLGKEPRRMSHSLIDVLTGNSALPEVEVLIEPSALSGSLGTVPSSATADFNKIVSPNAVCKYINLRCQLGQDDQNTSGWYEYAIILFTEQEVPPTNAGFASINTKTLGDIAIQKYRGKVLWNGAVPLNQDQCKVLELSIKIPNKWCRWARGQFLALFQYYRPADSVSVDTIKNVWSTQWKAYL